jgi:uncharacterized spore protein YtfJ
MAEGSVVAILQAIVSELRAMARSETIVGAPVSVGNRTVVPITKISVGFGAGGGEGTHEKATGFGGGGGGGVHIEPAAFLVIDGERIGVFPIQKKGAVDAILEAAPELIEAIKGWTGKRSPKGESKPSE